MKDPLLCTMDIGSGPRDPGLVNLLGSASVTQEQAERVSAFIKLVNPSLVEEYRRLASQEFPERLEAAKEFVTKLAVSSLEALGYHWSFDLEWPRTEMVDWERADVGGFTKSKDWQHSYGYRFWKPSEIVSELTFSDSDRHIEELERVKRYAKNQIRFPITDPHCEIHSNDNLFYYGKWLETEPDEVLASLKADHDATMEFARKVTVNRVTDLAKHVGDGQEIAIQLDNFIVSCEEREYDKSLLRKLNFDVPSYVQALREITPSLPKVRYFIHNCLQDYLLYVPYLLDVPNLEKFCFEMSSHDSEKLGTTDDQRKGPGFESLKLFKEYGLRKNQVVGVGVASTYEGAKPPPPELVRDRILYAVKVLEDPWKVQPVLDCGQRNLSLETMYQIGVNVHKGRDLALRQIENDYGVDVEPHLTKSYLRKEAG
jgi:5-methyltetrahydropteroyltriglutamate--homocysteine methyltransferase